MLVIYLLILLSISLLLMWIACNIGDKINEKRRSKIADKSKYLTKSPTTFKLIRSNGSNCNILDGKMEYYLLELVLNDIPVFTPLNMNNGSITEYDLSTAKYILGELNRGILYFEVDEPDSIKVRDNKGIYCVNHNFSASYREYLKLKFS